VFSRRTSWDIAPNAIAEAVDARRAAGRPLLDLTQTNPTRVRLPLPDAEIRAALQDAAPLRYDPAPFGDVTARAAVSAYYRGAVPPEQVALTASTSEAYAWLFKLLGDAGDRVLVPVPSYPLFDYLASLEGLETVPYPWGWDGDRWFVDLHALEERLEPRTRALVVVSPNNPTGAMVRTEEAERLLCLCAERGLALIADEVFGDHVFTEAPSRLRSFAGRSDALTFALGGLSKACLLPQVKVGWIAASGPADRLAEALNRLQVVADTYLSVNGAAQRAVPRLLALREAIRQPLMARLAANRAVLARALQGSPATPLPADGGWSAVLRVPRHPGEEARVLRLISRHGVLVHPGYFFDFPGEAFLVVSLLCPEDEFARGAAILAADAAE
jgi:aspartate/methionine/tyrosine aminotransferase